MSGNPCELNRGKLTHYQRVARLALLTYLSV